MFLEGKKETKAKKKPLNLKKKKASKRKKVPCRWDAICPVCKKGKKEGSKNIG